jgi:hypothetical protein
VSLPQSDSDTSAPDGSQSVVARDEHQADVGTGETLAAAGAAPVSALCGVVDCNPDDETACADYENPVLDAGTGGTDAGDAGADGDNLGEAGSGAEQGARLPSLDAAPSGDSTLIYGCQVVRHDERPLARCELSGTGQADDPCVSTGDCAPGLACVGDESVARCRPFCCAGDSDCETGTHCALRTLREASAGDSPLSIPVCVPADYCNLAEPYPCESPECTCSGGTACMVVRDDGTTSCIEPGSSTSGEKCPCASGHICSQATQTCLKLCMTNSNQDECGSGYCQAASLPENWGVCVGQTL